MENSELKTENLAHNSGDDETIFTGYVTDDNSDDNGLEMKKVKELPSLLGLGDKKKLKEDEEEEYEPADGPEIEEDDEETEELSQLEDEQEEEEFGDDGYSLYGLRRSNRSQKKNYIDEDDEGDGKNSNGKQQLLAARKKKTIESDEDFMGTFGAEDEEEEEEGSDFENEIGTHYKYEQENEDSFIDDDEDDDDDDYSGNDFGYRKKRRVLKVKKSEYFSSEEEAIKKRKKAASNSQEEDSEGSDWGRRNRIYGKVVKPSKPHHHSRNRERLQTSQNGWMKATKPAAKVSKIVNSDSDLDDNGKRMKRVAGKQISYKEHETDEDDESNDVDDMVPTPGSPSTLPPLKTIDKVIIHKPLEDMTSNKSPNKKSIQPNYPRMQYLIKWVNTAHIHNTWETESSLRQQEVGGIKKLENYIKTEKELENWKSHASPEDLEYYFCQKEMTDDLLQQYRILERIISSKIVEQTSIIKRKVKALISRNTKHLLNPSPHLISSTYSESESSSTLRKEHEETAFGDKNCEIQSETQTIEIKKDPLEMLNGDDMTLNSQYVEDEREIEEELITKEIMYLCKWNGLPYLESTWESESFIAQHFPAAIPVYEKRESSERIPYKTCKALRIRPRFNLMKDQPEYIGSLELILRDYQLDGVNWLARSWCKNNSVILADEMGLGKTIQVLSFCNYLFHQHQLYGPFLIVAPLSTIAAWQKESSLWAPDFNTVTYLGDVRSREMIQEYEWRHKATRRLKFNLLLTTYEILLKDKEFLSTINWALLAVDEAHRLKNEDSLLYRELIAFRTNFRLLITGTPLQNSLKELWALLHFIMPYKFDVWTEFESIHTNADKSGYTKLHKELEPFILRRIKKDVEKSLPAKVEQILRVEMTRLQKQYYKWILTKNYKALSKGSKGSVSSFLNIVMELKKCCNHTSLTKSEEVELPNHSDQLQRLFRGSGKLILLDKLLCKLKETGHRVLIFSQMVRMLDIIAEYLQYRCFLYQRLDGSIKNEIRKQSLDHFNAENSQDFCFLLSTRAGGLGVNLATADTVIIFDSDWNPQNDLQAQARAHRIGQKNQVNIYRLVTKNSIEEEIIQRAKQKMILDHLVIQRMNTTGKLVISGANNPSPSNHTSFSKAELSSILQFGAEDLFKADVNDDEEPQVDIDDILKRAETADEAPTSLAEELLSNFKITDFTGLEETLEQQVPTNKNAKKSKNSGGQDYSFKYENSGDSDSNGDNSSSNEMQGDINVGRKDWNDIIPKELRERVEMEEKQKEIMALNKIGPRKRKAIYEHLDLDSGNKRLNEKIKIGRNRDKDYDGRSANSNSDTESEHPREYKHSNKTKSKQDSKSLPFQDVEIRKFVKSFRKFPNPQNRLEEIVYDCDLQDKPSSEIKALCKALLSNYKEAMAHLNTLHGSGEVNSTNTITELDSSDVTFKINQLPFPLIPFKRSMEELECIYKLLPKDKNDRKKFKINIGLKNPNWGVTWTNEDDSKLLIGVYEHGIGNWEIIKMDTLLGLQNKILPNNNGKPKGKNLQTRLEYLIKTLKNSSISNLPQNSATSKKKKNKMDKRKDGEEMSRNASLNVSPNDTKDLPDDIFIICKEKMRPVKKSLKQLDYESKCEIATPALKSCLLIIGDHIYQICHQDPDITAPHTSSSSDRDTKIKEWLNFLWIFVSKFTEQESRYLHKLYKHEIKKRNLSHSTTPSIPPTSAASKTPSITMFFTKSNKHNAINNSKSPSYNCIIKTPTNSSTKSHHPSLNSNNSHTNKKSKSSTNSVKRYKEDIFT